MGFTSEPYSRYIPDTKMLEQRPIHKVEELYTESIEKYNEEIFSGSYEEHEDPAVEAKLQMWALPSLIEKQKDAEKYAITAERCEQVLESREPELLNRP